MTKQQIAQLKTDLDRAQLRAIIAAGAAAALGQGAEIAKRAIAIRNELTRQLAEAAR